MGGMWMSNEHLDALEQLTPTQRKAVQLALIEWHTVGTAEGRSEMKGWRGFPADVLHSAALRRLMRGAPLFVEKPRTEGGYPCYAELDAARAPVRIRQFPEYPLEGTTSEPERSSPRRGAKG